MNRRSGLTLLELIVVLTILVALASIVIPMFTNVREDAQGTVTRATMKQVSEVLARYKNDNDFYPVRGALGASLRPDLPQMRYLFVNPANESSTTTYDPLSRRGWNGPYLGAGYQTYHISAPLTAQGFTTDYGLEGDPTPVDGWNRPLVILKLVDGLNRQSFWMQSAGPDGILAVQRSGSALTVGGIAVTSPPEPHDASGGSLFHGTSVQDDIVLLLQAPR